MDLTPAYREKWDDFVLSQPDYSILQSFEWADFKSYFGWQPCGLVLEDNGQIIAGASILKREIPYLGKSLFYTPQGPVVDFMKPDRVESLFEAIKQKASLEHAVSLKIDPLVSEEDQVVVELLSEKGFLKQKKQIQPRATILIDLTQDLDALLAGFEPKTRYNIRLAEKKGVKVKEEATSQGIEAFYDLYLKTAQRDNFIIHPFDYYQKLKEILLERGMATVFTAYVSGRAVAAVFIFRFGKKVWYMYGASSDQYRNLMPNHLLHWEVIKWAKAKGYAVYDLWGIPSNPSENHPLWGVYRFKKGFNGTLKKYIGAYDLPYSKLGYLLVDKGMKIYQNMVSLVRKGKISDSLGE